MLLTEDREIIDIYNRKILVESTVGASQIYNPEMNDIFNDLLKNTNNKTRIYNKIDTHIQAKTQGSGSMFLDVTDANNLLGKIFHESNNDVTWEKYGDVGGADYVGYYAKIPNVRGLIGNLRKKDIPSPTIKLTDTKEDASHYGLQATVRISQNKLKETNLITIIFSKNDFSSDYNFSSMYPGPQSSNLHVDPNSGVTDPNIKAGNKISKTIFKKDLLNGSKLIIPYFRAI